MGLDQPYRSGPPRAWQPPAPRSRESPAAATLLAPGIRTPAPVGAGEPLPHPPGPAGHPGPPQPVTPATEAFRRRAAEFQVIGLRACRAARQHGYRAELERVGQRLARVDALIARVSSLPPPPGPERLAARLGELRRHDIEACLDRITRECQRRGARALSLRRDPDRWLDLLQDAAAALERRAAPRVAACAGPGGAIDRQPAREPAAPDSRAVMYGCGDVLHVVHDCAAERPVVELAELLDQDEPSGAQVWLDGCTEPSLPVPAAGVPALLADCYRVSLGHRDRRDAVFEQRMPACPVSLAAVAGDARVQAALAGCRGAGDRRAALAALHEAVRRVAAAVDVSVLVPEHVVAAVPARRPDPAPRGAGARLAVLHGAGAAAGWDITAARRGRVR
ncbi:hypothetical protein Ate01nite_60480 [Actinoplanes teichomyceticus]|nr:hypothetical protein Ate01nite_60480 [Actinoplanes teichomyceticus]